MEKPGLLPPRPETSGAAGDGGARGSGRRPADVYLPNWDLKGPVAFDLAVTSGMCPGTLASTADAGDRPVLDYEARKRQHLDTQRLCSDAGVQFVPLVAEACGGGWGPVWSMLRAAVGSLSGDPGSVETERLQQSLSVCLQRERRGSPAPSAC